MSEQKHYPAPTMVDRKCAWCGCPFQARAADVKRGWGLFCSKSCKALKQEKRTGANRQFRDRQEAQAKWGGEREFSDAHLFSNEDHGFCSKD